MAAPEAFSMAGLNALVSASLAIWFTLFRNLMSPFATFARSFVFRPDNLASASAFAFPALPPEMESALYDVVLNTAAAARLSISRSGAASAVAKSAKQRTRAEGNCMAAGEKWETERNGRDQKNAAQLQKLGWGEKKRGKNEALVPSICLL